MTEKNQALFFNIDLYLFSDDRLVDSPVRGMAAVVLPVTSVVASSSSATTSASDDGAGVG